MKILKYSEWQPTAWTLHMVLQMIGKVKLEKMRSQPEWNHVLLYPTAQGFTTGLIPNGEQSFDISINIGTSMVYAHCIDGTVAGFPLRNRTSVSEYFHDFHKMLINVGNDVKFNTIPQEVGDTTPFDEQIKKCDYDCEAAADYYHMTVFARNALLEFAAAFRGKKILPALFWGTFDVSTVLFSGLESPFPGDGIIEKVAFDEKFIEFGFWPGDPAVDDPMFFVLAYPFMETDLTGSAIAPKEAFFSKEKKEFFLPMKEIFKYENPQQEIEKFCDSAFRILCSEEKWDSIDWFTKPLLI